MINYSKIETTELQLIANYLLQNKDNIEQVISDFGEVESDNGHGTLFLKPKCQLFKVVWIYIQDGKITSAGFGGPHLGLTLKSLISTYKKNNEGYVPYDNEYVYVFYSSDDFRYTVKIDSKNKLFKKEEIINDVPINSFVITLK